MKKTFLAFSIFFLLCSRSCIAQGELDGYKIIYLPYISYADTTIDKWNEVHVQAKAAFEKIGFRVYDNVQQLPDQILQNKCEIIYCKADFCTKTVKDPRDIRHTYLVVNLRITDCRDSILKEVECTDEYPGSTWASIYREATQKAARRIGKRYKYDAAKKDKRIKSWFPAAIMTQETEETLNAYFASHKLDSLEGIYETAFNTPTMPYYKIGIKKFGVDYQAIIIESDFLAWKPGELKAYLKKDPLSGVRYSAKWYYRDKLPLDTYCEFDYENGLLMLSTHWEKYQRTDTFRKLVPKK
jgi:hypothetical protein